MENSEGTSKKTRKPRKSGGKRRNWSREEELHLISALEDLVKNGWRVQGAFRNGYLGVIEQSFRLLYPNTDMKADPHINSKLTAWKRQMAFLKDALGPSGNFKLDPHTMMVVVDNEDYWSELVKKNRDYEQLRYKSFPHYTKWQEIFGTDRASGEACADAGQLEGESRIHPTSNTVDGSKTDDQDSMSDREALNGSISQSMGSSSRKKGGRPKKRKSQELVMTPVSQPLIDMMGTFMRETKEVFGTLTQRLVAPENETGMQRKKIFEALGHIPGMDPTKQIFLANKLAHDPASMDVFFSLPSVDVRANYVKLLLNSGGN